MTKKKARFPESQFGKFFNTSRDQFRILDKDGKPKKDDKEIEEKCKEILEKARGL